MREYGINKQKLSVFFFFLFWQQELRSNMETFYLKSSIIENIESAFNKTGSGKK